MITLQLQDINGKQLFLDTDENSKFSIRWTNPFFCVGVTNLSHTQDLSVPSTDNNSEILNMDNVAVAEGWRHGRRCWLGYSGGEIEGKLFLKNYDNLRYNLLFVYGSELDDVLSQPISNIWQPSETIVIKPPKLEDYIADFGWLNYNELYGDQSFSHGIEIMPAVNLGWLMDQASGNSGYRFFVDGNTLHNIPAPQYNPYNYALTLDSVNAGKTYDLYLEIFNSASSIYFGNHQCKDENHVNVPDSAAGLTVSQKTLWWLRPVVGNYYVFEAVRPITIILDYAPHIACRVNTGGYPGTDDPYNNPGIHYPVRLDLTAGMFFTFFATQDYQYDGVYGNTPFFYHFQIIDSETSADMGDSIRLSDNLPNVTLLQLAMNYCLMTSSYFEIDGVSKSINITTINNAISRRFSNGRIIHVETDERLISKGQLTRFIDGYSQHNIVRCDSASYVVDNQSFRVDYPCDNDLLDEENEIGVITYNDGNMTEEGEAVFQNIEIQANGGVNLKPLTGICYMNQSGNGYAYHIRWVDENYNMSRGLASLTSLASSILITLRENLVDFFKRNPEDIIDYASRFWLIKEETWQDDITQLTLVSTEGALSNAPAVPDYLRFRGDPGSKIQIISNYHDLPEFEYSTDGGVTWKSWHYIDSGDHRTFDTIYLDENDWLFVRGNNGQLNDGFYEFTQFGMGGKVYADGDCGTLIDMVGGEDIILPNFAFYQLFAQCHTLAQAPYVAASVMSRYCCARMYEDCENLAILPPLRATTFNVRCYYRMFHGCSSLSDIVMMTYVNYNPSDYPLDEWLLDVSGTGKLTCDQSLALPVNSTSGLPSGWVRYDL